MLEGLPPNNATHVLRLDCTQAQGEAVATLIFETCDPADVAVGYFEIDPNKAQWQSDEWRLEAFFRAAPDEAAIRALVAGAAGAACAAAARFERVARADWVAAALAGLDNVRAGRFVVHGAHGRAGVRANDVALEIEAALAFGTGHHGTTRGCLLALDAILKRRRPRRILDVGTGTGVLAMAAAAALKVNVAAGDIDAVAVGAARANAKLNGLGERLRPVVARGPDHPALRAGAPYDLIFGNILARPLRLIAPAVCALAARDADIVLSGLLARDVPGVGAAYAALGFKLASRRDIEGWATLMLRRGGAAARAAF